MFSSTTCLLGIKKIKYLCIFGILCRAKSFITPILHEHTQINLIVILKCFQFISYYVFFVLKLDILSRQYTRMDGLGRTFLKVRQRTKGHCLIVNLW